MMPSPGRHKKSDPVLKRRDGVSGNSDEAPRIINLCNMRRVVDIKFRPPYHRKKNPRILLFRGLCGPQCRSRG